MKAMDSSLDLGLVEILCTRFLHIRNSECHLNDLRVVS